ncbi:hypothetical protein SRHO_G00080420 [Serrasalmus rhombeus]
MERFQIPPPPKFDFTRPEEWPKWIKRFDRFRIASGLELQAEENQVNTLIYTMGDEAEDIITALQLTVIEASQYNAVKNKLNAHFVVRRNVIFERAKFNQRQQEQGETVDSFITSLHCLSEHCGYGHLHNEMVRDRLVVGLRDKKLSEQLQLDSELTLEKAVTRARQNEQVKNQQDLLKSNFKSAATDVDSIQTKLQPATGKNEVRICVDLTKLNESVKRERHILPSVEHTLGQLEGAKVFSKIDANSGFWQIPLAKESALLTTFLTPFGRFCFNRLCFRISSAPEHYQKRMSRILEGLDGVLCQMDDILVFGDTQAQHDTRLSAVLGRLQEAGVTLRSEKCEFSKRHVKFLGQIIDAAGVRADPDKVRAVTDMGEPEDASGVRRFLGMVNHLGKYFPNLAEKTQPLRDLLKKQNTFQWGHQQQRAFNNIKKELSSPPGLALYNSKAETVVSADASSFGLGAVLLQRQEEGYLKPVAYSSRALTETEKRYAQIEKEALAITWACERFSDYLVGIRFHVETDHKPLVPLLGSKSLDELPPRIQRLRMRLMAFCYSISHVAGKKLATADVLSRAPLRESEQLKQEEEIKLYVNMVMSTLPATEKRLHEIRKCQEGDEILSQVKKYCNEGWPDRSQIDRAYLPYIQVEEELTVEDGLLLKGCRLVIPKALQTDILQKLHAGHQGIAKCRERAKQSVWWPGLSTQLQKVVEGCDTCAKERDNAREPLLTSEFPDRPWARVGADLFQWDDNQYLIVVDYFSRFIEVAKLTSTTSLAVVEHCKSIFARHGIPSEVMTDNGPQFASECFKKFAEQWGFTHTTSSPRYAQSNGEAERAVQTIKGLLQKEKDPYLALLAYRATPLANGHSPTQPVSPVTCTRYPARERQPPGYLKDFVFK